MKKTIKKIIGALGYKLVSNRMSYDMDYEKEFIKEFESLEPYTVTSIERMYALKKSVQYIVDNHIDGDFVECGVWKGGSCMMIANTLLENDQQNRELWMYDTFEGMTMPTEDDLEGETIEGDKVLDLMKSTEKNTDKSNIWAYAPEDLVRKNMESTGYPVSSIRYVKGKVEETLVDTKPELIALLRLDTDWYESTKFELARLYPLINDGGILIIDDYGHFEGARKAVDEYFKFIKEKPFMHRIDPTGRLIIKKIS